MESPQNKYQNGKIYKIWNTINDEIYVGSSYEPLCKRMTCHRSDAKLIKKQTSKLYKLMSELGIDAFHIELIENYPCDNREELRQREGYYIKLIGTLNMIIEGRTRLEYREDNKDKITSYMKQYRDDNKEHILESTKQYRENNVDKLKQYKTDNKEHIVEQSKEYYQRTKDQQCEYQKSEKVKAWKNTKIECPCGGTYTLCHKAEHFKSAKHKLHDTTNIVSLNTNP